MKKSQGHDLFDYRMRKDLANTAPLATRMRPQRLEEFIGQEPVVGEGSVLRRSIREDSVASMILWGPPGSGKTTLARIIARESRSHFFPLSAVSAGVADLRAVIQKARDLRSMEGKRSILFIDEIHRFNKAQQDAVLPFVENGLVTLIGATTENPSFEVNSALLSRCRVYRLKALEEEHLSLIIGRALENMETGMARHNPRIDEKAMSFLITRAHGDARIALNTLELAVMAAAPDDGGGRRVTLELMEDALQHRATLYDKKGEQHYDLISALHKSMRNSDPDAAIYWLGRMIEGGEDPLYIARRLVRFASEDVGLADPGALLQAVAAYQAVHFVGLPEADVALAQAAVYLSLTQKSNALYRAMLQVKDDIRNKPEYPVPMAIRNAVTGLMKAHGYGEGYRYAHDFEERITDMACLPEALEGRRYFTPSSSGWEEEASRRLIEIKKGIKKRKSPKAQKSLKEAQNACPGADH
ncbi:MAG: replication-associated recombination protein A [Candidatus Eremiobacteraeota bacterium]|nr:replication-associated recombination protein A [Candidatus Eremiobacteraeota bacterium]